MGQVGLIGGEVSRLEVGVGKRRRNLEAGSDSWRAGLDGGGRVHLTRGEVNRLEVCGGQEAVYAHWLVGKQTREFRRAFDL